MTCPKVLELHQLDSVIKCDKEYGSGLRLNISPNLMITKRHTACCESSDGKARGALQRVSPGVAEI
jgi:hypothetical protein